MNNPSHPLTPDEVHLVKEVFEAVDRNFYRFVFVELFLFIMLARHFALALYIRANEKAAVGSTGLIAGIFIWLSTISHHFTEIYYTHRNALRQDMRQNIKYTCSGRLSENKFKGNRFIYYVYGQAVLITNKSTLLGWKIEGFDALKDTNITLDYLPNSGLSLNIQYPEMHLHATSKKTRLSEDQIQVLAGIPKKERPVQQVLYEGLITHHGINVARFSDFLFYRNERSLPVYIKTVECKDGESPVNRSFQTNTSRAVS